jgi:hypothetical protein
MALMISGHPRSGTTLLTRLCNNHPDIGITFELANFFFLQSPWWKYTFLQTKRYLADKRILIYRPQPNYTMRALRYLRSHLFAIRYLIKLGFYQQTNINVPGIQKTLHQMFPQARIVGDKYPGYIFYFEKFADLEDLTRLVIYRDGRDVASSTLLKARTKWQDLPWVTEFNTPAKVAARWVHAIEMMERYADKLYMLRYEDLVNQPAQELTALAQWLGVDPAGFDWENVYATSVGSHKSDLTPEELDAFMEIAGPTMARLGYL